MRTFKQEHLGEFTPECKTALIFGEWIHTFVTQLENAIDDGVLKREQMHRTLQRVSHSFWDGVGGGR